MGRIRHKRKKSHVVIVTSDSVDAGVQQYRIRPWMLQMIIFVLSVVIGVLIGCLLYEKDVWADKLQQTAAKQEIINALEQENRELEQEIADLNDQVLGLNQNIADQDERISILSAALERQVQNEETLTKEIEKLSLPTEFPLTEGATMTESTEGDPLCVFTAKQGSMVVATAKGTVMVVNDDLQYGHNVWIDHGNGYVTIYRNKGEAKVKQGETVMQGATLFLIEEGNRELGYQMMQNGVYIDPMDMLSISG